MKEKLDRLVNKENQQHVQEVSSMQVCRKHLYVDCLYIFLSFVLVIPLHVHARRCDEVQVCDPLHCFACIVFMILFVLFVFKPIHSRQCLRKH